MKKLAILIVLAAPAAAQAMGMHGMRFYGSHSTAGMHLAGALYALMAALGYWVLHHAAREKETAAYVKRAGQGVGWVLIVVGLLGLLCAVTSHVKQNSCCGDRPAWNMRVDEETSAKPGERTIKVEMKRESKEVKGK